MTVISKKQNRLRTRQTWSHDAAPGRSEDVAEFAGREELFRKPQVTRILVPIDFSVASVRALQHATLLAGHFGASICAVHVIDPASFGGSAPNAPVVTRTTDLANKLHHKLVMLAQKEVTPLILVHPVVLIGRPFHEIITLARSRQIDLIVLASHGHSSLKEVLLGSTAERVVRHAPCPVLVVREHGEQDTKPTIEPS